MINNHIKIFILLATIISFLITFISIPTILRVTRMTGWLDKPDKRKIHKKAVPRLGGVAIFASLSITLLLFYAFFESSLLSSLLISIIILFFIGIKDDILITAPLTKFLGQLLAVSILVILGFVRITNLHGFFNIFSIPPWIGIPLTILIILAIINSFNFVDGIDGLAAILAIEIAAAFGWWFYNRGFYQYTLIAMVLIVSLFAYLRYNLSSGEKKIFMGDTGTMLIGLVIGLLAIKFNELSLRFTDLKDFPAPAVSFGIMIIPLYDLLRVIFVRIVIGKHFFEPDQNHIHHIFLRLHISQCNTLILLSLINLLFIFLSFFLAKYFSIRRLLLILFILISIIIYLPAHILRKKEIK